MRQEAEKSMLRTAAHRVGYGHIEHSVMSGRRRWLCKDQCGALAAVTPLLLQTDEGVLRQGSTESKGSPFLADVHRKPVETAPITYRSAMTSSRSSEELQRRHIQVLGQELGAVYHALENEYFWVRLKWQEFVALFASAERVEILNAAAPAYFLILQDVLSDDILMHLARLTDPPKTGNKRNLTVRSLPELVTDGDIMLPELVRTVMDKTEFARDWRNRRLAHRDLGLALGESVKSLEPATREAIDVALDSLHAVFSHFSAKHFGEHLDHEVIEARGSAESLLHVLGAGLAHEQAQYGRLANDRVKNE